MNVKTKFNIGDKVFFYTVDGKIGKGIISRIGVNIVDKSSGKDIFYETSVMYEIRPEQNGLSRRIFKGALFNFILNKYLYFIVEKDIFSTKEELLNAL